jgi:hypothetical protein
MDSQKTSLKCLLYTMLAVVAGITSAGCDRKEKVIDIDTPGGDIEVERSTGTGKVDVDVDVDDKQVAVRPARRSLSSEALQSTPNVRLQGSLRYSFMRD